MVPPTSSRSVGTSGAGDTCLGAAPSGVSLVCVGVVALGGLALLKCLCFGVTDLDMKDPRSPALMDSFRCSMVASV